MFAHDVRDERANDNGAAHWHRSQWSVRRNGLKPIARRALASRLAFVRRKYSSASSRPMASQMRARLCGDGGISALREGRFCPICIFADPELLILKTTNAAPATGRHFRLRSVCFLLLGAAVRDHAIDGSLAKPGQFFCSVFGDRFRPVSRFGRGIDADRLQDRIVKHQDPAAHLCGFQDRSLACGFHFRLAKSVWQDQAGKTFTEKVGVRFVKTFYFTIRRRGFL
jgi:hypothetical protein